ncbi:MAG: aspartate--ammonia ligase [Eubacteriales bacterium]|nr:aspartate--ammonia ligase [Eubacteriales bacterium]
MDKSFIPEGYISRLDLYETQEAIETIKLHFADLLCKALNLKRVSAPLFVETDSGLNDDLSGKERPVRFDIKHMDRNAEVVHSLAKWKRMALKNYNFPVGEGLYTDMNAIRRDEVLDNLHSIYVDQWDWEKVINEDMRSMATLKDIMQRIVTAICLTLDILKWKYPRIDLNLQREATFVTSQELEDRYPTLSPKEREYEFVKEHKTCCILQIGKRLKSGESHDMRAPDYDDWDLNGDILFWHETLKMPMELSSMGIRVSPESLLKQLKAASCEHRLAYPFHSMLAQGKLPYTVGGGIGQSRLCMLLLQKAHIGEVQSSCWDEDTLKVCSTAGVRLL